MKLWFGKGAWASKKAIAKLAVLDPGQVKKIAVIRHAALGDMVLTRPFLYELRKCFPNAHITLSLVSNYTRGAPEDLVDNVHVSYGSDRREKGLREQIQRARELGEQDLIFDLAATPRSFWVCLLNKARFKIGFPYTQLQRRLFFDATVLRSDMEFEAETMLDMLRLLGFKAGYPPLFNLPGERLQRERPYVVYFTSASGEYKCWPKGHFAQLLGVMAQRYPEHDHLVLEGVAAWESIDEIMAPNHSHENVIGLNLDSVEETIALLKGAQLLISNDTGIRNLGIAAETPTLGIFFATHPFKTAPFRYLPCSGQHDLVFNHDGSVPAVEQVSAAAQAQMQKLI
jgi:ADP-heptose:LPS heptosyltransferase